jgi:hypothetical protein
VGLSVDHVTIWRWVLSYEYPAYARAIAELKESGDLS